MQRQNEAIQVILNGPFFQLHTPTPRCHRLQRLLWAAIGSRGQCEGSLGILE